MKSLLFIAVYLAFSSLSYANTDLPGLSKFINEMHEQHGFDKAELASTFEQVEVKKSILKAISRKIPNISKHV